MCDFIGKNPGEALVAFCMLLLVTYHIIKLFVDRNKPIVECDCEQCDCGCHEDEDEDEDEDEESL